MLPTGKLQVELNVPTPKTTRYQVVPPGYSPGPHLISPREYEILQLTLQGLDVKTVCKQLNIAEKTLKFHRTNLYRKYGVSSITGLLVKIISEKDEQIKQLKLHNNV